MGWGLLWEEGGGFGLGFRFCPRFWPSLFCSRAGAGAGPGAGAGGGWLGPGAWGLAPGAWGLGPGGLGPGAWGLGPGIGAWGLGRAWGLGPGTWRLLEAAAGAVEGALSSGGSVGWGLGAGGPGWAWGLEPVSAVDEEDGLTFFSRSRAHLRTAQTLDPPTSDLEPSRQRGYRQDVHDRQVIRMFSH